jgi:hypothetical protein
MPSEEHAGSLDTAPIAGALPRSMRDTGVWSSIALADGTRHSLHALGGNIDPLSRHETGLLNGAAQLLQ